MDKRRLANILIPTICTAMVVIPPTAVAIAQMEPIAPPEPIITQIYDVRISPGAKIELDKRKVQEKTRYETTIEATGDKKIIGLNSIQIEDRDEPLIEGQDYTFNLDTSKLVIYENVVDGDVTINVAFDKVDVKIISAGQIDCDKTTLNYHKKDVLILRTDVVVTSISNILIYVGEERATTGFSWIYVTEQNSTAIYISFSDPNIVIDTITIYVPLPGETELVIDAPEDVSFSQTLITPGRFFWTTVYSSQPLSEEIYVYVNGNRISGGLIDFNCYNEWYGVHYENNLEINASAFKEGDVVTVKLFAESGERSKVNVVSSKGLDKYFDLNKIASPNVRYEDTLVLRKDAPADLQVENIYLYLTNKRGDTYNINFNYWDHYLDENGFYTIYGGNFRVPSEYIDEEITIHIEEHDQHAVILSDACKQFMSLSQEYVYDGPAAKAFDIRSEIGFGTIKVTDDNGHVFKQHEDFEFYASANGQWGDFWMYPHVEVDGALNIDFENLPQEYETISADRSDRYKLDCSHVAKQWNEWTLTATVLDSRYKFYGKPTISFTIASSYEDSYQIESWDEDHVTFTIRNYWGSTGEVKVGIYPPQAATWTINTDGCYFLNSDGSKTKSFNFYSQGDDYYFKLYFEKPTDINASSWATVTNGAETQTSDDGYFWASNQSRDGREVEMYMNHYSQSPQNWRSCTFNFKMCESTQLNVSVGDGDEYTDQMIFNNNTSLNREFKEILYFKPDATINSEDIIFDDVKVTIGGTTYTSDQINVMTGYDEYKQLNYLSVSGKTPIQVTGPVSIDMPVLPAAELVATQEGVTFSKPRAYKSSESDLITFVNSDKPLSNQIEIEVNGKQLTTDQYVYVPDWSNQYHSAYLMIDKNVLKPDNVKKVTITTHTLPSVNVELTNHTDLFKLSYTKILKGSINYFSILWNIPGDKHSDFSRTIKGIHLFSSGGEILTGWSYKLARSRTLDISDESIDISIDDPTICDQDITITIDYEEFHK